MLPHSHWVSKHFQDFEQDAALRSQTIAFLDDITCSPNLLPGEHRAASQLLRLLCRDDIENNQMHLDKLLTPPKVIRHANVSENNILKDFNFHKIIAATKQREHRDIISVGNC